MYDRIPTPGKENRVKITQDDGTVVEGVLAYADDATQEGSAYTKGNVLPDSVLSLIGLPTESSEPADMFNVLATAGDLHVWRRTVDGVVDYPVSTNPNAYQEGSDAQPAGYTLGEVVTGMFYLTDPYNPSVYSSFKQGEYTVSEDGELSLPSSNSIAFYGYESSQQAVQSIVGKKTIKAGQSVGSFVLDQAYYFPEDAVVTHGGGSGNRGYWTINKYQPVTGYPAIPAGTTIEYLGKLGDKARIVTGRYVGTGTYGEANPNTLTFRFDVNLFVVQGPDNNSDPIARIAVKGSNLFGSSANWSSFSSVTWNGRTVSWYGNDESAQANRLGLIYYYVAFG